MTKSSTSIEPQFRSIDGLNIRFAESEDWDQAALLLCPWPESILAFDQIWSRLAEHAHLVAVDLPGFGHSERRDSLLAPRAMGGFVARLADVFGLERPHAVGPDVGTPALLFAAADNPGRFASLVVGGGAVAFPLEVGWNLNNWIVAEDIDRFRSLDPRAIVSGALSRIKNYAVPEAVREDYLSAYDGDRFVESIRFVRAYPAELPILGELLPKIQAPVQIIAGLWDWMVPPSNHKYLDERLPNSKLDLLDAGHYTWEDAPDQYAELITRWWTGG